MIRGTVRRRGGWWSLLALAVTFLLMTRSRAALLGCIIALLAMWWLDASVQAKFASAAGGIAVAGVLAVALLMTGWTDMDDWLKLALLGRTDEQHESLSGRIPIWEFGWRDALKRPISGYGFNSYWTDERLQDAHIELEWALPDVHNAYLETLLSIGWIGLLLVLGCAFPGNVEYGGAASTDR